MQFKKAYEAALAKARVFAEAAGVAGDLPTAAMQLGLSAGAVELLPRQPAASAAEPRRPALFLRATDRVIPGLELSEASHRLFMREAFKLPQTKEKTGQKYPVALIELPREGRIAVIQLAEARPPAMDGLFTGQVLTWSAQMREGLLIDVERLWFDPTRVMERTGYVRATPTEREERAPAPAAPRPPIL